MAKKQSTKKPIVKKLTVSSLKNKKDKKDNLHAFVKDVLKFCKSKTPISLTTLCTNYSISKSYAAILVRVRLIGVHETKGKLKSYYNISLDSTPKDIENLRDLLKKYNSSKSYEKAKSVITNIIDNAITNTPIDNFSKEIDDVANKLKNTKDTKQFVEKTESEISEDVKQLKEAFNEMSKLDLTERLPEGYCSGMFKTIKDRQLDELIINVAFNSIHDEALEAAEKLVLVYNSSVSQDKKVQIIEKQYIAESDVVKVNLQAKIDELIKSKHLIENELTMAKGQLELKNNQSKLTEIKTSTQIKQLETELSNSNKQRGFFKRLNYLFSNKLS